MYNIDMKHLIFIMTLFLLLQPIYSMENMDTTKIYLATIGPGDDIFLRWGHFGVVIDYEETTDLFFDYGNFSFEQDDFLSSFIQGVMTYAKARKSADYVIGSYINENRTITLQELNLTPKQKEMYIRKLYDEIQEKNMYYQYDQYYNNCVSEMINYLNELTEGAYFDNTDVLINRSFRDLSRDYISSNYLNNILIMFVLGSKVDHNITIKESLFLPDYAMSRADEVFINSQNGLIPLVKSKIIVNKSINRDPVIKNVKPRISLSIFIGIIIAILSLLLSMNKKLTTLIQLPIGLIFGLLGSLLFFMAFFTGHYYIHNNWNLIMVNPLLFILLIGAILKLSKRFKDVGERIISLFIDGTTLLIVAMLILKSIDLINQDNGEIIALLAPVYIVNSSLKLLFSDQLGRLTKLSTKPSRDLPASNSASLDESITVEDSSK